MSAHTRVRKKARRRAHTNVHRNAHRTVRGDRSPRGPERNFNVNAGFANNAQL
jgi:hypothetical protein